MQEKKYLNEERYQQSVNKIKKISKILLIVGITVLIVGIILLVLGFVDFGNAATKSMNDFDFGRASSRAFGSVGLTAIGGFVTFIGFGLTIGGVFATVVAHGREIKAFTVQQSMPIAQEGIETIAPSIGRAAETISKGISRGIAEGKKETEDK